MDILVNLKNHFEKQMKMDDKKLEKKEKEYLEDKFDQFKIQKVEEERRLKKENEQLKNENRVLNSKLNHARNCRNCLNW